MCCVVGIKHCDLCGIIDGQGGGRKTPGCFPESIRFLFIHIKPAGWRYVRGVGGWGNGRKSGTSVFAEECKNYACSRVFHVSIARSVLRTCVEV